MVDNFTLENAFKALEEVQEEIEVTPRIKEKTKALNESIKAPKKKIIESPTLDPQYDSRDSFYGKAEVVEEDGDKVLYSYGTKVAKITKDNKVELLSGSLPETRGYKVMLWCYSPTTLRHVKEFLKQNGFKAESKSQMEKDYLRKNESCNLKEEVSSLEKELGKDWKDIVLQDDSSSEGGTSFSGETLGEFLNEIDGEEVKTLDELNKILKECGILPLKGKVNESTKFNLKDVDQVKQAKEFKESNEDKESNIEQVVDVNASTIDELKDSYVGNAILQCPVCKTLIYKKPEELKKDETSELYNIDLECPHCGSEKGFELVGQVAKLDNKEEPKEDKPSEDDSTSKVDLGSIDGEDNIEESKKDVTLENLDETKFDKLINKYLHNVYENVDTYTTTKGSLDDTTNKVIMEGTIKYTSGKEVPTKFIFEALSITKHNSIKLKGLNESFSKARTPFTLLGRIKSNNLVCECLRYNYNTKQLNKSKKVKGSVYLRDKKEIKK